MKAAAKRLHTLQAGTPAAPLCFMGKESDMATLTKKERAWLNELQDVLDRCPSPKKIGFYTIGDKSIYLYGEGGCKPYPCSA